MIRGAFLYNLLRILCFCLLIFIGFGSSFGYTYTIKVVEQGDSIDIDAAEVKTLTTDSVYVKSVTTDGYGIAICNDLPASNYLIEISKTGYYPNVIKVDLKDDRNLGTVCIESESSYALQEIVIEGARVTRDAEKMTIIPLKEVVNASINPLDVLRRLDLPGITVNPLSKELTIRDRAAVIKVDGVPQTIDFLATLPPDRIARIEYSDNPGARYLQDGVGGVINVILKKQTQGGSLYAQLQAEPVTINVSPSINLSYNYKDSEFRFSGSLKWFNIKRHPDRTTSDLTYLGDDGYIRQRYLHREYPRSGNSEDLSLSYQYQNSHNLLLNVALRFAHSETYQRTRGIGSVDYGPDYDVYGKASRISNSPTLDVFFRKDFSGSKRLEANITGSLGRSKLWSLYGEDNPEEVFLADRYNFSTSKGLIGELRWSQPVGKLSWQVGVKETYARGDNEYTGSVYDNMTNSRTYLSTSFSGQVKTFSYNFGGGVSYTDSRGEGFHDKIWQPSAMLSLSYDPTSWLMLSLFGNYEPSFPRQGFRTVVSENTSPDMWTAGNPDLKTSHLVSVVVEPSVRLGHWSAGISPWLLYKKNPVYWNYRYTDEGNFIYTPSNIDYNTVLLVPLSVRYAGLFNHLDIMVKLIYTYLKYKFDDKTSRSFGNLYPQISIDGYWGNFYVSARCKLVEKSIDGYQKSRYSSTNSIYIGYRLKNWNFTAYIENIGYGKKGFSMLDDYEYPNVIGYNEKCYPRTGNQVGIEVAYSFEFGRRYQTKIQTLRNRIVNETTLEEL